MSEDNVYNFEEAEKSAFDIPPEAPATTETETMTSATPAQQQGQEQTPVNNQNSIQEPAYDTSEDTYNPVDEEEAVENNKNSPESCNDSERPQVSELTETQENTDPRVLEKSDETITEATSNQQEVNTEAPTDEPNNQSSENPQDKEEDEEDEEDEYDPLATPILTIPTTASTNQTSPPTSDLSKKQGQQEDEEDDDDEEYDPTASVAQSLPAKPIEASTTSTSQTSTELPVAQDLLQTLTARLLADPTFLQLSDAEKQKKISEEFVKLQSATSEKQLIGSHRPDIRSPMSLDERNKYNSFLDSEAKYHTRFPHKPNSRLFVGNIPTNHVGKEEIWRIFQVYGKILQIALKSAYGFIQFDNAKSVQKAIEAERGIPLYHKDLVLEVAKNSRPEEMSQSKAHDKKRSRSDDYNNSSSYQNNTKGPKMRKVLDCQIFIKQVADPDFAREVSRIFQNNGLTTEYHFLKPGQDLHKMINEAAYSGCLSVVLVNKFRTVDVQVYEKTPDGGVRFDEYISINTNDAINLLLNAKQKAGGSNSNSQFGSNQEHSNDRRGRGNGYQQSRSNNHQSGFDRSQFQQSFALPPPQTQTQPQPPANNVLQSLSALSPQDLQNLISLAQSQQPQQQQPVYQQQMYQPPPAVYQPPQPQVPSQNDAVSALLASLAKPSVPQQQFQQHPPPPTQYQPDSQYDPTRPSQPTNNDSGSQIAQLLATMKQLQK